jgi:LacI family transcriptional regulator
MPITLRDIAGRAGVSPSVVSTVLSGRENGTFVSKETRRRVLEMASELNYVPVRAGRPRGSKRVRRTEGELVIGVWSPDSDLASHAAILSLQSALEVDLDTALAQSEADETATMPMGIRLVSTQDLARLDMLGLVGFVIIGDVNLPRTAAASGLPCVQFGEPELTLRDSLTAHLDSITAGQDIAAHLWDLGHRRIAFAAPESKPRATRHRWQGMQTALAERDAQVGSLIPAPYGCENDLSLTLKEQATATICKLFPTGKPGPETPTAIVCFDERVATYVLQTLYGLGLRVPADVSVATFGNTPGGADSVWPPLTSISIPVSDIIDEITDELHKRIDAARAAAISGESMLRPLGPRREITYPGTLLVRDSTVPPPS